MALVVCKCKVRVHVHVAWASVGRWKIGWHTLALTDVEGD